jgi:putative membrane protein
MPWSALWQWSFEPVPVLAAAAAVFLYVQGRRHQPDTAPRSRSWDFGDTCFAIGMATLLLALVSPIAVFDTQLQWDHMLQHVILLVLAPPLILLADPFRTAWWGVQALRGLPPAQGRAPNHRGVRWSHRGRRFAAVAILLAFSVNLLLWHLPGLYNLTLQNDAVHDLEHTLFFGLGLLFWSQVIGPLGASGRLRLGDRAALALAGMLVSWGLAVVIGYASHPLYAYPSSAGAIGGLVDQEIASGIMWVPGGVPFLVALVYFGCAWFENEERIAAAAGLGLE